MLSSNSNRLRLWSGGRINGIDRNWRAFWVFQSIDNSTRCKQFKDTLLLLLLLVVVVVGIRWDEMEKTHSLTHSTQYCIYTKDYRKKLGLEVISCAQLSCQIAVLVSNIIEWWCLVQMSMLFNMNWTHLIDEWKWYVDDLLIQQKESLIEWEIDFDLNLLLNSLLLLCLPNNNLTTKKPRSTD